MAFVGSTEVWLAHRVRDSSGGLCQGQEMRWVEEAEKRSHLVPGLDRSLHFGREVPEEEVGLAD